MGLAVRLLNRLEDEALKRGVKTAYTIARVDSYGMNRVFVKLGYRYAGCLINNTQIGGRIRSMYVRYKRLKRPPCLISRPGTIKSALEDG
jgi:beta-lysine N6-acetyltransferase